MEIHMVKPYFIKVSKPWRELSSVFFDIKISNPELFKDIDFTSLDWFNEHDLDDFTCITFFNPKYVSNLLEISKRGNFSIRVVDASNEIFLNKFDFSGAKEEFLECLRSYILKNFNKDDVLDKINKLGLDSLTDIDRIILESR
jgi:hypothetical protein